MRKRPISKSRFTPSSARRMSFKMNQSLKTMEVLLCSAFMMAEERQGFIKHWIWRNTLVGLAISSPSFAFEVAAVRDARKELLM